MRPVFLAAYTRDVCILVRLKLRERTFRYKLSFRFCTKETCRRPSGAFAVGVLSQFTLFKLRGIPVQVHFSLGLAFVIMVYQWGVWGLPAGVVLFSSVLAHELGHAMMARRLGISTRSIHLHLLGGTAAISENPDSPADEIMIAAAGPVVSLGLAALGFAASGILGLTSSMTLTSLSGVFSFFGAVNLMLGLFNLIPALPMDGGRIFRGFLARKMRHTKATQLAAKVARVIAVGLGLVGIFSANLSLTLIALFVFFLSKREEHMANVKESSRRFAEQWESQLPDSPHQIVIDVTPSSGRHRWTA